MRKQNQLSWGICEMKEIDIVDLLKSYRVCKKFLQSQEYAKEYFDSDNTQILVKKDQYETRMNVVESLIQTLEPSDEYTLLRLHHIEGVPIEKCAECMGVSRRTAFRILKKAHANIGNLIDMKGGAE